MLAMCVAGETLLHWCSSIVAYAPLAAAAQPLVTLCDGNHIMQHGAVMMAALSKFILPLLT